MNQKEQIINEAIREFLSIGVDLKLSEVAKNIGISKKTIYRYFKGKEDLLNQAVDCFFLRMHDEQTSIFNDLNINELDRLKKLMIAMPKDINNFNINFLNDLNNEYPSVYKRVNHYLESDWDQTFELLDLCKNKGLIKDIDNNVFREMFIGCTERIFDLHNLNLDFDKVQNQMIDILIGGIKNA